MKRSHSNRVIKYYKEHGLAGTINRLAEIFWRNIFQNRTIIYYVDFQTLPDTIFDLPDNIIINRRQCAGEISGQEIQEILIQRGNNAELLEFTQLINERFNKGAQFWTIQYKNKFAGFLWSIRSKFVGPYYLPVKDNDVVILDIETFPKFRGLGLNPVLMNYSFNELKKEGAVRAYGMVKAWNKASINALAKTHFKKYSIARKFQLLRRNITLWYEM